MDTTNMINPKKNTGLYALIALCAVLFVCMLVLCGVYLNLSINGIGSPLPEIPANDRHLLQGTDDHVRSVDRSMFSPTFVGVKLSDGSMLAASYDADTRQNIEAFLEEAYDVLFTGKAEPIVFADQAERNAYVDALKNSERYVYASYFSNVPSSAVLPCFHGGSFSEHGTPFFVKYIFLLPDGDGNLYGIVLDHDLNAVKLIPSTPYAYTAEEFYAYTNMRGYEPFEFTENIRPTALFTKSFDVNRVLIMPSVSFYELELSDENTKKLLTALDFNTNMVKSFRSGDNDTVSFIEDGKELYVSLPDSSLSYDADEDGIHMSAFLGYYPISGKHYSFSDTVLAVKYLLGSLGRVLVGGDAAPTLVGVTSTDDGYTFSLKYFYHGVLLTEDAADITVTTAGNTIRNIRIHAIFCDGGMLTRPTLPASLALSVIDMENASDRDVEYHALFEKSATSNTVGLTWIIRKAGK